MATNKWGSRLCNALVEVITLKKIHMKIYIILLSLFFQSCAINNQNNHENDVKVFDFDQCKVKISACNNNSGSSIEIIENGKRIFYSCDNDGAYFEVDTIDINKDKKRDFIFIYSYDDYSTLGAIVSVGNEYKKLCIMDNLYNKHDCSVEPYEVGDEKIKRFVIIDINEDGKKDVVTIAGKNDNGSISTTECSIVILNEELIRKIKK